MLLRGLIIGIRSGVVVVGLRCLKDTAFVSSGLRMGFLIERSCSGLK